MTKERLESFLPPEIGPGREIAAESLRRTRKVLAARSFYLAIAMFMTTMVLVFLPETKDSLVADLRKAGKPGAIVTYAAATVFWVLFLLKCRQAAATGIPPKKGLRARNAWGLGTLLVWLVTWELARAFTGTALSAGIGAIVGVAGIWLGEKLRQVETADEIRWRSTTQRILDDSDQDNG